MQAGGRLAVAEIPSRKVLAALLFSSSGDETVYDELRRQLRLDCDVLVNCTGLHGAGNLFGDKSVYPIRGQVR